MALLMHDLSCFKNAQGACKLSKGILNTTLPPNTCAKHSTAQSSPIKLQHAVTKIWNESCTSILWEGSALADARRMGYFRTAPATKHLNPKIQS
eukprot:4755372-Amphidinium_carterae.1